MLCIFPTMILLMAISSTPPVQAVAQLQAIGTMFQLTQQIMLVRGIQLPSTPTMLCIFPTMILTMTISSMPPVQAVVHLQAIGTMFQLTVYTQVMWVRGIQSPSIPTMLCIFPTVILPIITSSIPPVQAVAQLQAIGTMSPLTQVMWDITLQSPSIPMMLSTFPTMILPIKTSSMPPVQAVAQLQAIGTMFLLTQQVMWDRILQ